MLYLGKSPHYTKLNHPFHQEAIEKKTEEALYIKGGRESGSGADRQPIEAQLNLDNLKIEWTKVIEDDLWKSKEEQLHSIFL